MWNITSNEWALSWLCRYIYNIVMSNRRMFEVFVKYRFHFIHKSNFSVSLSMLRLSCTFTLHNEGWWRTMYVTTFSLLELEWNWVCQFPMPTFNIESIAMYVFVCVWAHVHYPRMDKRFNYISIVTPFYNSENCEKRNSNHANKYQCRSPKRT